MADNNSLYALRTSDGAVKWYIDEEYAIERGVDPSQLVCVEIPRNLLQSGSIQEISEYVAIRLEEQESGTA